MNHEGRCILAIDAGGTFLKAALIRGSEESARLVEGSFFKIPVDSGGNAEEIKAAYMEVASRGRFLSQKNKVKLEGISVCIPGPFDYPAGISRMRHKYPSIYGISMRPWLEQAAGRIPICFLHDSTAFLLGATQNGFSSRYHRIAGVVLGTGLGFASMFDGKVCENDQGGPGISIYAMRYRDKTAEDYVSRHALLSHYKELRQGSGCHDGTFSGDTEMDVIDIANLARSGQAAAIQAFESMGICLAEILYDIIKDNRFECLLLGGGICKSADLFLPALRGILKEIPTLKVIEAITDIDHASLLGAARAMQFS